MSDGRLSRSLAGGLAALALILVLAGPAAAKGGGGAKVLERPVSFQVTNVNESKLACATDGATYNVRGHIVGTKSELRSSKSATLYLHGLGLGQFFWDYHLVPGYDFAAGLAQKGQVSVVIDRLGYASSGKPLGGGSCIGGQATIAHEIVTALRSGDYRGSTTPKFKRVGLVGHSAGGQIAQVEAYSFGDVDAVGVLAYADQGFSELQLKAAATAAAICAAGGQPSDETSGPSGYAKLGQTPQEGKEAFFASATGRIVFKTLPLLTSNPCGDLASYEKAPAVDLANIGSIDVPVLAVQGGRDALFPVPDVKRQSQLYTGSPAVTYALMPRSGHALTLEADHLRLEAVVARFLKKAGL